jgi:hypothetical protein
LRDRASTPKALAHSTLACGLLLRSTRSSTRFDAAAQASVVSTRALPAASNLNRYTIRSIHVLGVFFSNNFVSKFKSRK